MKDWTNDQNERQMVAEKIRDKERKKEVEGNEEEWEDW